MNSTKFSSMKNFVITKKRTLETFLMHSIMPQRAFIKPLRCGAIKHPQTNRIGNREHKMKCSHECQIFFARIKFCVFIAITRGTKTQACWTRDLRTFHLESRSKKLQSIRATLIPFNSHKMLDFLPFRYLRRPIAISFSLISFSLHRRSLPDFINNNWQQPNMKGTTNKKRINNNNKWGKTTTTRQRRKKDEEKNREPAKRRPQNAPKYSRQHFCMNRISFFYALWPFIPIIYITFIRASITDAAWFAMMKEREKTVRTLINNISKRWIWPMLLHVVPHWYPRLVHRCVAVWVPDQCIPHWKWDGADIPESKEPNVL